MKPCGPIGMLSKAFPVSPLQYPFRAKKTVPNLKQLEEVVKHLELSELFSIGALHSSSASIGGCQYWSFAALELFIKVLSALLSLRIGVLKHWSPSFKVCQHWRLSLLEF